MSRSKLDDITVVPQPTQTQLEERQLVDYRAHREEMLEWLLHIGKTPKQAEGYAKATLKVEAYRIDKFYRWVWEQEDGYTTQITTQHADDYMRDLAYSDYSDEHKSKCMKAVKMLFKWREHERNGDHWEPEITFNTGSSSSNPRDYFTREERAKLREAVLEYGSIPSYSSVSPEERSDWKIYLSQRFEKPKSEITKEDWERANSWKTPSLVWASLDAGLRPIEVERANVSWVDVENGILRIPKEESSKNVDNWKVGLQDRTARILDKWIEEREQYHKYSDTDSLWLTQRGNSYSSASLKYILEELCDIADIPTENRKISWYTIRHSVGTYMTREEDLAAAQAQLRHKSEQTTMKYDQTPVEERQDALNNMG